MFSFIEYLTTEELKDIQETAPETLIKQALPLEIANVYELRKPIQFQESLPWLFIITGPSGAGKDCIIQPFIDNKTFTPLITATSREIRTNEGENPNSYIWIRKPYINESPADYLAEVSIEYDLIEANYKNEAVYGLPRRSLLQLDKTNINILRTGAFAIPKISELQKDSFNLCTIFVLPENYQQLWGRIAGRGEELSRMRNAFKTIQLAKQDANYLLMNREFCDADTGITGIDISRNSLFELTSNIISGKLLL